jgi:hypothetical protein
MVYNKAYLRRQAALAPASSEDGLIIGVNSIVENGVVVDLSSNGHNATPIKVTAEGNTFVNCLNTNSNGYLNFGVHADFVNQAAMSWSVWFNQKTSAAYACIAVVLNNISPCYFIGTLSGTTLRIYINGINWVNSDVEVSLNRWYHVGISFDAGTVRIFLNGSEVATNIHGTISSTINLANEALTMGYDVKRDNYPFKGLLGPFQMFSTVKPPSWFQAEYERGKQALFRGDWGAILSSTPQTACLENTPCRIGSGSFSVVDDTIEAAPVKVIQCESDGYLAIPYGFFNLSASEAAYGTWEGWIYKELDASDMYIFFVSSANVAPDDATQNGYAILFSSTEAIKILKITAGSATILASTADAAFALGTWYKFKTQRRYNGQIALYLNDTLVTVASGTNPIIDTTHTSSNFCGLSGYAGDKFSWADSGGNSHCFVKRILP